LPFIDIAKIEFKTRDSDFVDSKHYGQLIENATRCLASSVSAKKTTYIKIVVSSKTKLKDFESLIDKIFNTVAKEEIDGFVIQPTFGVAEPSLELLLEMYDVVYPYYMDVKVVPQLHKLIGAP
jgi:hypothetical protein